MGDGDDDWLAPVQEVDDAVGEEHHAGTSYCGAPNDGDSLRRSRGSLDAPEGCRELRIEAGPAASPARVLLVLPDRLDTASTRSRATSMLMYLNRSADGATARAGLAGVGEAQHGRRCLPQPW